MEELIFEHFNSEGHTGFLENVPVTFIDKTDSQSLKMSAERYYGTYFN